MCSGIKPIFAFKILQPPDYTANFLHFSWEAFDFVIQQKKALYFAVFGICFGYPWFLKIKLEYSCAVIKSTTLIWQEPCFCAYKTNILWRKTDQLDFGSKLWTFSARHSTVADSCNFFVGADFQKTSFPWDISSKFVRINVLSRILNFSLLKYRRKIAFDMVTYVHEHPLTFEKFQRPNR